MHNAYLFDDRRSERVKEWRATCEKLETDQLLWLSLRDPSEDEWAAVARALGLGQEHVDRLQESSERRWAARPSVANDEQHLYVTLVAVAGDADTPELVPVQCVIGPNWVVTAHHGEVEVLDEFLEVAEGGGAIGVLEAPSFVAAICEWVVASYLRAFEEVESELEKLDETIISTTPGRNVSSELGQLVALRRRVGALRRALAPHREVVVLLAHPELDALSTEQSAQRFADLEDRVARALDAARETKESTFGTFDLLDARIGQRTNDIMKVLTLGTVILLPATVLGGIMGMNFRVGFFENTSLFWAVVAVMILIAILVLAAARVRHWI